MLVIKKDNKIQTKFHVLEKNSELTNGKFQPYEVDNWQVLNFRGWQMARAEIKGCRFTVLNLGKLCNAHISD